MKIPMSFLTLLLNRGFYILIHISTFGYHWKDITIKTELFIFNSEQKKASDILSYYSVSTHRLNATWEYRLFLPSSLIYPAFITLQKQIKNKLCLRKQKAMNNKMITDIFTHRLNIQNETKL
jgi:hypothetical protein